MKRPMAAAFLALAAAALLGTAHGQQGYKSFQLLYHSDTRGYHRPCG